MPRGRPLPNRVRQAAKARAQAHGQRRKANGRFMATPRRKKRRRVA